MIPIKSTNTRQEDIINDILKLHNNSNPIDVDVTYPKGIFYKSGEVKEPLMKFDLTPQTDDTIQASSEDLPLDNNSVTCMMFDPPFVIAGNTYKDNKEGSSKIAKRFSAYTNYNELKKHYKNTLKEARRVLKKDGILIIKCQNTVSGGKQHFTHYFIINEVMKLGMYPKDEFVLQNKSKMTSFQDKDGVGGRWKQQLHSMKHHSFFIVIQNKKCRVDYE